MPKSEPADNTVREFCRQDFLGSRLSAVGWNRIKQLVAWKDNPVWKSFRIVSRYEQTAGSKGFHSAHVTVQYQVLGGFELGMGYAPMAQSQNVDFTLKETDGEWRIESTDPEVLEPHISRQVAVQWLQDKLKTVTDRGDKSSIENALQQLTAK